MTPSQLIKSLDQLRKVGYLNAITFMQVFNIVNPSLAMSREDVQDYIREGKLDVLVVKGVYNVLYPEVMRWVSRGSVVEAEWEAIIQDLYNRYGAPQKERAITRNLQYSSLSAEDLDFAVSLIAPDQLGQKRLKENPIVTCPKEGDSSEQERKGLRDAILFRKSNHRV